MQVEGVLADIDTQKRHGIHERSSSGKERNPVSLDSLGFSSRADHLIKGNMYFFRMKVHVGFDAESGLVHGLVGTATNVADMTQFDQLLHGEETYMCGDAGCTGVDKRLEHQNRKMIWSIAARPSSYKKQAETSLIGRLRRKIEHAKAQVRAKVEHPCRVIKRQFGYTKVRFRGLAKNIAQQTTLFALSNLWMVRKRMLNAGEVRL